MIDAKIARKLAHLHIKKDLGKIAAPNHKQWVTRTGRKQKYSLETGRLAKQAARAVVEIVSDYQTVNYLEVNRYADTMIVSDGELHLVRLDFEDSPDGDFAPLRAETMFAYFEIKDLYPIKTVVRTTINPRTAQSATYSIPLNKFLKGD